MYRIIFHAFAYYEIYSMPMAISMLHGYSHKPYSIPMAILHARSYTSFPWPYFILKAILYEISFIYRLIIHAFTYHEICSMPIAISMPHEN